MASGTHGTHADERPAAGTPVVFVHGSGSSGRDWEAVIARLGWQPGRAVALDLPGHGARAAEPLPPPDVAAYAEAVRRSAAERGLARVVVVGHSLGSAIALRLALDAPELVAGVGLVGGGARLRVLPDLLEQARTHPEEAQRRILALAFAAEHQDQLEGYLAGPGSAPTAPTALHNDLAACDRFDVVGELGRVAQPALVVVGEADRLTPPKYAAYLAEHLPRARLVTVPGAGHLVLYEAPEAVARALREWLG